MTASAAPPRDYLRDPAAITSESFARIRAEAPLSDLPADVAAIVERVIHACGMPDILDDLAFTPDIAERLTAALAAGAPILLDSKMTMAGLMRTRLPADNPVLCFIDHPETAEMARSLGTTRSAAAVELWRPHLSGAVCIVGNAPTALFHLLDLLERDVPPPAAVLGFPVGFVGARESKDALCVYGGGAAYMTLRGRRGGSAMAAAALNAALLMLAASQRGPVEQP